MSELSEVVDIVITQDTVGVPQAGFGTPMVLSHNASFPEMVRYYSGTLEASLDWATTSPEYRAIRSVFSQSPHVRQVGVGKATSTMKQQYTIGVSALRNLDAKSYRVNVSGQGVTDTTVAYTTDSTASEAKIHTGLVLALGGILTGNFEPEFSPLVYADKVFTANSGSEVFTVVAHGLKTGDGPFQVSNSGGALPTGLLTATDYWVIAIDADTFFLATSLALALAGTHLFISTNGTGTQTISDTASTVRPFDPITVTGNALGAWFSLEVTDPSALSIRQSHADPGVAADLDAILLEDNAWYCLITLYNSDAYVRAAATWVEAQTKIYVFDTVNTQSITVAASIGTDALALMHTDAFERSSGTYYPNPSKMQPAAWAGRVLCIEPGGETWAFKTLATVTPTRLRTTHRNNLTARNSNWFQTVAGRNVTQYGTTFNGNFLDIVRGKDWLEDDMSKAIFATLTSNDKISFDDAGVSNIENDVVASLDRAVQRKILRAKPRPVVTVPLVADVPDADRALRTVPDIKFSAELAGAIHKVRVTGVVSV